MKATLTADDPIGWYLCRRIHAKHLCCNWWDREHLRSSPLLGELNLSLYEDFRRLFTESDVAALREELTALRDEVKRLKSQPYELRRADKPDCVGLWRNAHGDICKAKSDKDIDSFGEAPPYYLLGPIPVIVEQQPRVVTIKAREDGETCRAIPTKQGTYMILDADGCICEETNRTSWEEVQP